MKAVILAGGFGTRLSEETSVRPKPMVEIGGKPILWHIMKHYSAHGINEFVICCGYKGYLIKEYFANYFLHSSDVTIDIKNNEMEVHHQSAEPWRVTLVDTGEDSMTGGRLLRVRNYVDGGDFCFTYGDGLSDVNLKDLIAFHEREAVTATITAVQPPGRFGVIRSEGTKILSFKEKPEGHDSWINGGFAVLSPNVFDLLQDDQTIWERGPLETLAKKGQLAAYYHEGFWQPMDTLRDRQALEELWESGNPPWKTWK